MKNPTKKEIQNKLLSEQLRFKELFETILDECEFFNFHDNLLLAILKRAIDVVDTVGYALRKYNLNTLYPLLRLQIDNCLILQAALLHKDNSKFFDKLLDKDFQPKNFKIPLTDQPMTERKLAKILTDDFPDFLSNYEYCCDFVHFTSLSLALPVRKTERLTFKMSAETGNKEDKYRVLYFATKLFDTDDVLITLVNKCRKEFVPFKK